jgi:hypothetical protein
MYLGVIYSSVRTKCTVCIRLRPLHHCTAQDVHVLSHGSTLHAALPCIWHAVALHYLVIT